jgi:RNA polymerase sigma factor for flagellar operon FliA
MDGQRLFLENLGTIDRVVAAVARRHRLSTHEHDEFRSLVRLRLLEDDARVLRAFEKRSSLATYLTIVISRIFLDFRNQEWGRWRPSAQARRLGEVAVLLDRLMTRDGHLIEEAIEILRTNHKIAMSDTEIRALWDALPRRHQTTLVGEEAAREVSAPDDPASATEFPGHAASGQRVAQALARSLSRLSSQDRLIVQLQFRHGVGATDLAHHFGMSKATLHRRVNRILAQLRDAFQAEKITPLEIIVLLRSGSVEFPDVLEALDETLPGAVRLFSRDE